MANRNEAKITFNAETKAFNASIKNANSELSKLRAEAKLNETQMKNTGTSVEGLERQHENLEAQLKASESKTEALTNKVETAKRVFGENSDEVAKLEVQLINAQTAEEKLRGAVEDCKKQLEDQKAASEDVESASKNLAETIDEQQTKLNSLKDAYVDAVLQCGKNSTEAKNLAKEIKSLSSELSENKSRMNDAEDAADKLDKSMDDAKDSGKDLGEGFTVLKGAMADLVSEGISAVIDGFKDVASEVANCANDIDSATNTYIARTGESAESAEEFREVMTNIYKGNYGESFEDIADAMATVKTALGDIGSDELEKVTTDALILRDTFDMDVNESIRAVNSMMDQFGVTADEAFNMIAEGAQNGLNQNGDLLDIVNEYSVQFKNAGFSAEDMFNMLANGVEAGTWNVDKLGDALKEMNIRLSDGTADEALAELGFGLEESTASAEDLARAALDVSNAELALSDAQAAASEALKEHGKNSTEYKKAINDVTDAQFALKDAQSEYNAVASETQYNLDDIKAKFAAGGETAQEAMSQVITAIMGVEDEQERYILGQTIMGTMWEDLGEDAIKALMNTQGEISTTSDALDEINNVKYNDLGSALEGVKRTLTTSIAEPINTEVLPVLSDFENAVDWPALGETISSGVGTAVEAVLGFVDGVQECVSWMEEHPVAAKAMGAAIGILAGVLTGLAVAAKIYTVAQLAMNSAILANPVTWIVVGIVAAIAAVVAIVVILIEHWDEIKAKVTEVWGSIKETLSSWGEWINTNVVQPVAEFFAELWNTVSETAISVWDSIKEFFSGIAEWFNSNVIQPIVDFFTGLWESIVNIWNTICNAVQVAIMLIGEILSAAFQIITLPFMFIWENCKEYVFAAWEWIKEKVNAAITFVSDIISTMWTGIQVITSTVWTAISTFISNIWNAIKEKVTTAINTVKTIVSTIWTGIKTITSTIWNAVVSVVSSVWDSISSKVSTAINAVKGVVSNIWNSIKSTTSNIWNSVKTTISSVWDGIKSTVSNAINNVKNTISNVFTSAKNTISNILDSIKNKFSSIFDTVKSTVSNAIKTIKGYLNFSWELPKIKLPHFSISGSFSLNPPSIPTFSVSWYKDAYDSAKVLKAPMIFGFSAASGKLLGGGDGHGNEVVAGESHLIDLIEGAVEKASNVVNLQALADAIEDIANRPIYLNVNGRRVAVAMAGDSDSVNGLRSTFTERGLVLD